MAAGKLTPLARENLSRAWAAWQRGERSGLSSSSSLRYIRSRHHGDRPSLAALWSRGLLERRPTRGTADSRDAAFEYRISDAVLEAVARGRNMDEAESV